MNCPAWRKFPCGPSRNFTFATGLRAILRQDPDVVMVGEIRDSETAEIAIRAALTGHQVFSTLHTNDSTGAVTRLIDMGVEAFLISSSLEGVLAQRLVRRICPHCRAESPVTPAHSRAKLEALGRPRIDRGVLSRQQAARNAADTGYRGRIGIFELLAVTPELRELILQKRSNAELKARRAKNHDHDAPGCFAESRGGNDVAGRNPAGVLRRLARMNAFRYQAMEPVARPSRRDRSRRS